MSDIILFDELLKSSPHAVIELFQLHLDVNIHGSDTIFYFYNGVVIQTQSGEIVYQGKTYAAIPVEAEGFEYTAGQTSFPRPTLRVGNLFSVVSALMLNVNETTFGNDLTGAKVVRIRTLSRFLDAVNFTGNTNPYGTPSGEQMPQEIYFVNRKIVENRDVVEFELAAKLDLENIKAPKRQCLANVCQWEYKGGADGTRDGCTWRPGTTHDARFYDENDNLLGSSAATSFTYSTGDEILASGASLTAGQFLTSSNGWYRAQFGNNGDFFIYAKNQDPNNIQEVRWRTATSGRGGTSVKMGANGDLFITDGTTSHWNSGTSFTGTPSTVRWDSYLPEGVGGRHASFYHEIFGDADDYTDDTVVHTHDETFTLNDGRTIELRLSAKSKALPAGDANLGLGVLRRWESVSGNAFSAPATVQSSSGHFFANETITVSLETTSSGANRNPFAHRTDGLGEKFPIISAVYTITAVTDNYAGATAVLQNNGNLQIIDTASTILWQSYSGKTGEPQIVTGTANPLDDVCGKRLNSCKIRFGNTADLPFGSFPGVGTTFS